MLSKCFVSAENETEKGTLIEKKSQTIHMLPKKTRRGPLVSSLVLQANFSGEKCRPKIHNFASFYQTIIEVFMKFCENNE